MSVFNVVDWRTLYSKTTRNLTKNFKSLVNNHPQAEKVNEAEIAIEEEALKKKQETQNPICKLVNQKPSVKFKQQ